MEAQQSRGDRAAEKNLRAGEGPVLPLVSPEAVCAKCFLASAVGAQLQLPPWHLSWDFPFQQALEAKLGHS